MATPATDVEEILDQGRAQQTAESETQADLSVLTGPQKAAALLLALGTDWGSPIWQELSDDEVVSVSVAMSELGNVTNELTQSLLMDFRCLFRGHLTARFAQH